MLVPVCVFSGIWLETPPWAPKKLTASARPTATFIPRERSTVPPLVQQYPVEWGKPMGRAEPAEPVMLGWCAPGAQTCAEEMRPGIKRVGKPFS